MTIAAAEVRGSICTMRLIIKPLLHSMTLISKLSIDYHSFATLITNLKVTTIIYMILLLCLSCMLCHQSPFFY